HRNSMQLRQYRWTGVGSDGAWFRDWDATQSRCAPHDLECLMEFADFRWDALVRHPSSHSDATRSIDVHALVEESGVVVFKYVLRAEISCVRIAPAAPAERTEGLWKHTCFEAFIRAPGA